MIDAKISEASPPTYYDRPALKPSHWGWLVATYFFIGGMAGAAQLVAGVVDVLGHRRDRPLVSAGRYLALVGALISPVLLIADLQTPSRWYNMLRIYRGTSPMSIGSWTLAIFGATTGLAATGQFAADVLGATRGRRLARLAGIPAALAGALLASYTGVLLASTSTPLWATGFRLLPAIFGLSSTATATAALSLVLGTRRQGHASLSRLERLGFLASTLELVLTWRQDALWRAADLATPLESPPLVLPYRAGAFGLGILTPITIQVLRFLTRRELRAASTLASLAVLIGGYAQRVVLVLAGKRSAERPTDYFRLTATAAE